MCFVHLKRDLGVQAGLASDMVTEAGLELLIRPHFLPTGMGNDEASTYLRLGLRGGDDDTVFEPLIQSF